MAAKERVVAVPMRIQARHGSKVEKYYYPTSRLPGAQWPDPKAIAPGILPSPLDDLIFHGGKVVPQMTFQNVYLGSAGDWAQRDIDLIDGAILRAMQDRRLNNVIGQYFPGASISCDFTQSVVLSDAKPVEVGEADVQAKIAQLFRSGKIAARDLGAAIFNLVLPPGTILTLDTATSPDGLGGYHGSIHVDSGAGRVTLYYSANVFSQVLPDGRHNGIVAFDEPWKNVVATLYHELNEFRTDADVNDAIQSNNNDFLGWMSRQGRECGDQPIFVAKALSQVFQEVLAGTPAAKVPVQFMYSNAVHGAEGPIDTPDAPAAAALPAARAASPGAAQFAAVDAAITSHLDELLKPSVLSLRPGYQIANGWITKKPAIVVTIDKKQADGAAANRIPAMVAGYPVDVREAGPLELIRARNRRLFRSVSAYATAEHRLPAMPYERDMNGDSFAALEKSVAAAGAPAKLPLAYSPPPDRPLDPITDTFTIVCHASPDAGWATLKDFLAKTTASLTVGMYDFTSAHILEAVQASTQGDRTLSLVLDHPSRNRTADQSDEETQAALAAGLDQRLSFAWALEGNDPKASAAIFPSAYHIKVAVRDSSAFWLSSGNWNNSNQPDVDPLTDPAGARGTLASSDRDWHVIVVHDQLAQLFEAYLANDLAVASRHQAAAAAQAGATIDELAALAQPAAAGQSQIPKQFFAPKVIKARMTIQPLLTPDNYPAAILSLINSAAKKLYVQVPYITPNDQPDGATLGGLIDAIAAKIRAGLDVRIILSSFEKPAALEQLQAAGIDASLVRIQTNLHNKGIIVDSSAVAIGSQNWSPPGVTTNRDATLLIENADAAQYWEAIFLHDWDNMAVQRIGG
jgi:PLD-like domain